MFLCRDEMVFCDLSAGRYKRLVEIRNLFVVILSRMTGCAVERSFACVVRRDT